MRSLITLLMAALLLAGCGGRPVAQPMPATEVSRVYGGHVVAKSSEGYELRGEYQWIGSRCYWFSHAPGYGGTMTFIPLPEIQTEAQCRP